jgi:hypothetical protein
LNRDILKPKIKLGIAITVIAMIIAYAIFTVMKYQVEGEEKVPFKIGKIIVISSASTTNDDSAGKEGETQEGEQQGDKQAEQQGEEQAEQSEQTEANENYIWNEKVVQTNDLYIYLDKCEDYGKEEIIKSVKIENIQILKNVNLGKIQVYMPNSLNDGFYKYTNEFLVNSQLTYTGAAVDNAKTLEICNQGGGIYISFANLGLGNYKSNDDQEIEQGGTILEKMNISNEDLKFRVSFDLVIEVQDKTYKTNLTLDLPEDGVVGQKETHREITDFSKVVFKRL